MEGWVEDTFTFPMSFPSSMLRSSEASYVQTVRNEAVAYVAGRGWMMKGRPVAVVGESEIPSETKITVSIQVMRRADDRKEVEPQLERPAAPDASTTRIDDVFDRLRRRHG